ncbi:hypothetical protein KIPE111705_35940 [Kibdelosporangium persicum]|uniref:Uncharacterized protein n=1 Tax=Kibdelosporangium persicum TaxID=2698649 RepID=A0ABX2F9M3_9PSEU|nr:hypothetical protein [Kibdelosporangium persicum]NRN67829.1 hypothetical protein [Kibdelosporangium persicum]
MSDHESAQARELLSELLRDEPPVTTDSATLVRKGRRRAVIVRSAAIGGVTLGVVGAVLAATLARPEPDMSPALPVVTTTSQTPTKMRLFTEDDRSRRLSRALQDAKDQFIPPGLIVAAEPDTWGVETALQVVKANTNGLLRPQWAYFASVHVGNDKDGYGSLSVHVNSTGTEGRCATPGVPPLNNDVLVECTDTTLPDGTRAAVSRYEGRSPTGFSGHESYRQLAVEAVRPDGTRIYVSATNRAPGMYMASPGAVPLRAEPPLGTADVLKIVQLPGMRF